MLLKNNSLAILLLLFALQHTYGQERPGRRMLSYYKELVYVELADQFATVYKLGRVYDKGLSGFSLDYIDTLVKQSGNNDGSYRGKKNQLFQNGNRYYLKLNKAWSKKDSPVELNPSSNIQKDYVAINNAYWLDAFIHLANEINTRFSWQHTSFRSYNHFTPDHQDLLPYEEFKILADKRINELRDSLIYRHEHYTTVTNEVVNNIGSIEYGILKERLNSLSEEPGGYSYFNIIFQKVCNSRPEWFYKLAEDMPSKKELMFGLVYGSSLVKKLKAVKTDSPAKKEFIKYKRRDRGLTFAAIGSSLAGAALLGLAIIVLF